MVFISSDARRIRSCGASIVRCQSLNRYARSYCRTSRRQIEVEIVECGFVYHTRWLTDKQRIRTALACIRSAIIRAVLQYVVNQVVVPLGKGQPGREIVKGWQLSAVVLRIRITTYEIIAEDKLTRAATRAIALEIEGHVGIADNTVVLEVQGSAIEKGHLDTISIRPTVVGETCIERACDIPNGLR